MGRGLWFLRCPLLVSSGDGPPKNNTGRGGQIILENMFQLNVVLTFSSISPPPLPATPEEIVLRASDGPQLPPRVLTQEVICLDSSSGSEDEKSSRDGKTEPEVPLLPPDPVFTLRDWLYFQIEKSSVLPHSV